MVSAPTSRISQSPRGEQAIAFLVGSNRRQPVERVDAAGRRENVWRTPTAATAMADSGESSAARAGTTRRSPMPSSAWALRRASIPASAAATSAIRRDVGARRSPISLATAPSRVSACGCEVRNERVDLFA